MQAWSAARISREATIPTSGVTTGCAARHVAHHIDVGDVFAKEADGGFGGFRDPLHQFLCLNVPHIGLAGRGMDHGLADPAVRAADTDVLVGAAEAALYMSLEMGQGQHGIIVQHALADGHLFEPLAAFHREHGRAFRVGNVYGGKGPAIHLQRLSVLLGGIAVAGVIVASGSRFSNSSLTKVRGMMLGPFFSPVWSLTAILPSRT